MTSISSSSLSSSIPKCGGGEDYSAGTSARGGEQRQTIDSGSPLNGKQCEGKEALCRAMGMLFLQHRVEKLQGDVDELEQKRKEEGGEGANRCSWRGRWKPGGCPTRQSRSARHGESQSAKRDWSVDGSTTNVCARLQHSHHSTTYAAHHQSTSRGRGGTDEAKRIIVADVSLLIYSLRTIHNWLKEGDCRVVVPREALRTLDVLKKGDHWLNLAARKATRFLDERFMAESEEGVMTAGGKEKGRDLAPGLVAQKEWEKITCAEWRRMEQSLGADHHPTSMEEIRQLANSVKETLNCSLYFAREFSKPESGHHDSDDNHHQGPTFSLALALPPPHFDCSEEIGGVNGQGIKYGQRADGNVLLQWAKHLGLGNDSVGLGNGLIVAPTAASWLTADGTSRDCR